MDCAMTIWKVCISVNEICFVSAHHKVTRTCISKIQINYFMVDQVCMSESNRRGFLCFCNDSLCNTSAINYKASRIFFGIIASIWFNIALRWSDIFNQNQSVKINVAFISIHCRKKFLSFQNLTEFCRIF